MFWGGRVGKPPFCPLSVGLRFVAFVSFFDGGSSGATLTHKRCLEKKVKEELGPWCLEVEALERRGMAGIFTTWLGLFMISNFIS